MKLDLSRLNRTNSSPALSGQQRRELHPCIMGCWATATALAIAATESSGEGADAVAVQADIVIP
jgi:hypothetical protein